MTISKDKFDREAVKQFITEIIGDSRAGSLEIYGYCKRKFGTTDNQVRALLIDLLREKRLVLDDAGWYRQPAGWRPPPYPHVSTGKHGVLIQTEETPDWLQEYLDTPDDVWFDPLTGEEFEDDDDGDTDDGYGGTSGDHGWYDPRPR